MENTAAALNELLQRFIAQWELLTGGPQEIGSEDFNRVLDLAKENLFDAVKLASEEFNLDIYLGSHVLRARNEDDEILFYNCCFGWVDGVQYATGYTTKSEADAENEHEMCLSPKLKDRMVLSFKDAQA